MKIKLLDNSTIQKIAAGEVIERPASIVKELVENSIDANAKNITVSIKNGGIDEILVSDDGDGIEEQDIEIAFKRHATSKIELFEDLYHIYSMGFRGEALASIIAAADLEIRTKSVSEEIGTKVEYKDAHVSDKTKIAMNKGTTIVVKDLFKNIPVRRNFLKSHISEGNCITELMQKLAIGNTGISFKYIKDSKIQFQTISSDEYLANISKVFGTSLSESLIYIEGNTDNYKYKGYITDNRFYRGNRSLQYIFVNNRYIEAKDISLKMERVYRQVIPNGKFPAFQLFIETDPENIDVNIHPNKQKIQFRFFDELTDSISKSLKDILIPKNLKTVSALTEDNDSPEQLFIKDDDKYKDLLNRYSNNFNPYKGELIEEKSLELFSDASISQDSIEEDEIFFTEKESDSYMDSDIDYKELKENEMIENLSEDEINEISSDLEFEKTKKIIDDNIFENYLYIGAVLKTYLIFEDRIREQMILIDQHAAHERIMYEKISKILNIEGAASQALIAPIIIEVSDNDIDLYNEFKFVFENMGFYSDLIGKYSIAIRAVPSFLEKIDFKRLFLDVLDILEIDNKYDSDYINDMIAMKACKSAVKAGDDLSEPEVEKLLEDLSHCDYPLSCPHGRPTFIVFDKSKLEKEFLRIK
ncbi:MAG: DNA mismatch repair endonuclease MutL [Tissierellia bacterium]|nr:DNA mismatch repair endonuclease MutL [Tissierellia bacterium]